jgi:hypothetical protein
VSRPDEPLEAPDVLDADLDREDGYDEVEAIQRDGEGPAPAAALTSLRLTRRRAGASARSAAQARTSGPVRKKPATNVKRPSTIVDYWSRTATWPNAVLLRRHEGESGLRAAALYKPDGDLPGHYDRTLDMSPMIVEWILSLAERTVSSGQPIAEKESFERPCGSVRYAACALPLSETQSKVDHVLCYLRILG